VKETEAARRARILAEVEKSLAEGLPPAEAEQWQYPPAPFLDVVPPEPPHSPAALVLLAIVMAVVAIAVATAFVDG
jgi:hypothetical protein